MGKVVRCIIRARIMSSARSKVRGRQRFRLSLSTRVKVRIMVL